ncbi:MAG: arsenate reductase/protein-tyrosine-phosphatase family protein [Gemmatimonadaceae bacterium]
MRHARAIAAARQCAGGGVLVVCHGNICRSPFAAAVLRRALAPDEIDVVSAGSVGPGRAVPQAAHACALERGEDLSAHRSQLLTRELLQAAGLVVVMDSAQRSLIVGRHGGEAARVVLLGDLDPEPIDKRAIRDPYAQSPEVFAEVFERIERCALVLAGALRSGLRSARAA